MKSAGGRSLYELQYDCLSATDVTPKSMGEFIRWNNSSWWCNHNKTKQNKIDQSHKSHNAPVPYLTIPHSEQKCTHFCSEWGIVGYGTGSLWYLWDWSNYAHISWDVLYNVMFPTQALPHKNWSRAPYINITTMTIYKWHQCEDNKMTDAAHAMLSMAKVLLVQFSSFRSLNVGDAALAAVTGTTSLAPYHSVKSLILSSR